jgi:putative ABC transport system substrate-binding protein
MQEQAAAQLLPSGHHGQLRLDVELLLRRPERTEPRTRKARTATLLATASIPIVMLLGVAPAEAGLVASLAHPGGNVTGTTVAPITAQDQFEGEARTLGLTLAMSDARRPDDVEPALARIARERPGALLVALGGPLLARIPQIIEFALQQRLPTIFPGARIPVDAGGLMSYGYDLPPLLRRAAWYIDRILGGAKPADFPVEQPTTVELVVNLETAAALGLTIPRSLLQRADHVIE